METLKDFNTVIKEMNIAADQIDASLIAPLKFIQYPLPEDQYYKEEHKKTQLVLHHSAGWDNARGMIDGWKFDKPKVATAFGVVDDGTIMQAFDAKYWAAHVGYWIRDNTGNVIPGNDRAYKLVPGTDNRETNLAIERRTIGIEICNWGNLTFRDGKYHTWVSTATRPVIVDPSKVVTYQTPFRGYQHFERYTEKEIDSVYRWIKFLCKQFGIPSKFDGNFDLNPNAINGVPGVYTHGNFRSDKSDTHPQPELIQMLRSL